MSTVTSVTTTLRRRRGLTEEAAVAAVDQACRRLRLPTMRALLGDAVAAANKDQLTYTGFLAELLLAECDDRDRRSTIRRVNGAGFRGASSSRTSTSTPTRTSTPPPSTSWRPASGCGRASRCA
ncbi:hypothetical protein MKOR_17800 [Mycolicibacillus koreensis]|nr:hypothetical protein MKOR_17800 [Mycolicibacillus koreensis]